MPIIKISSIIFILLVFTILFPVQTSLAAVAKIAATPQYFVKGFVTAGKLGGTPLAGAKVVINPGNKTSTTNSKGYYEFKKLAPGQYKISISRSGYESYASPSFTLKANKSANNIYLKQAAASKDIDKVKDILKDIKQSYLTSNNSLFIKHASKQTAAFLTDAKQEKVSSFTVNGVVQSGQYIVANWTAVSPSGKPETNNVVFIKEAGDWKFDMSATVQWEKDQANARKSQDNPSGLPDLVVTKAVIYPSRPVVNNKEVTIDIYIKNNGTKTADKGAPLVATLLGFKDIVPTQGGNLYPITPGETVIWVWHPYSFNDNFKISDTPGQKTIQIVLNKDREIVESNYDNNVFTQTVQMYSN